LLGNIESFKCQYQKMIVVDVFQIYH